MKFNRRKHAKHILNVYKSVYRYHEPYLVLADGTFCNSAVKFKIQVKKQLDGYLAGKVQCCTTKCILSELELLGDDMYPARMLAKRFQLRRCKHKTVVSAAKCIKSLLRNKEGVKYFVATQDPLLTEYIRSVPGIPLLYIHKNVVVLEKLSAATKSNIGVVTEERLSMGDEMENLIALKEAAGLIPKDEMTEKETAQAKRKRKKKQQIMLQRKKNQISNKKANTEKNIKRLKKFKNRT